MSTYVTCKNCQQLLPNCEYFCPNCKKEWYLDYSKCQHNNLDELNWNIFQTANPKVKRSEATCKHCINEILLCTTAVLLLHGGYEFQRPDGTILLIPKWKGKSKWN